MWVYSFTYYLYPKRYSKVSYVDKNIESVEVLVITFNEESLLPHFIQHYKTQFNASIVVYDNQSTDKTTQIAKDLGCTVKTFDSKNQINDNHYLYIKNYLWKQSKSDWVIIVDCDEFLELDFCIKEFTIVGAHGYDIVGDVTSRIGVFNPAYCKRTMLRPKAIHSINYSPGCHSCKPEGQIFSSGPATLLHRKYLSEEYVYNRHLMYKERLSEVNKKYGWGIEYQSITRESIKEKFESLRKNAILIP